MPKLSTLSTKQMIHGIFRNNRILKIDQHSSFPVSTVTQQTHQAQLHKKVKRLQSMAFFLFFVLFVKVFNWLRQKNQHKCY